MSKKLLLLPLIFLNLILTNIAPVDSQTVKKPCENTSTEAYFELKNSWIYICSESEQLFLLEISKNNPNYNLKIPASGGFPTYAGLVGDLEDPNGKIYNISPFYFQIIEASIITKIEPVLRTVEPNLGVEITTLSGEQKQASIAACGKNVPVQVFETNTFNIYICIQDQENNPNATNLTYIKSLKSNPNSVTRLKAELMSSFDYQTSTENGMSYIISYKGLETYQNGQKINTEAVTHVYLIPSDTTKNNY